LEIFSTPVQVEGTSDKLPEQATL